MICSWQLLRAIPLIGTSPTALQRTLQAVTTWHICVVVSSGDISLRSRLVSLSSEYFLSWERTRSLQFNPPPPSPTHKHTHILSKLIRRTHPSSQSCNTYSAGLCIQLQNSIRKRLNHHRRQSLQQTSQWNSFYNGYIT